MIGSGGGRGRGSLPESGRPRCRVPEPCRVLFGEEARDAEKRVKDCSVRRRRRRRYFAKSLSTFRRELVGVRRRIEAIGCSYRDRLPAAFCVSLRATPPFFPGSVPVAVFGKSLASFWRVRLSIVVSA